MHKQMIMHQKNKITLFKTSALKIFMVYFKYGKTDYHGTDYPAREG